MLQFLLTLNQTYLQTKKKFDDSYYYSRILSWATLVAYLLTATGNVVHLQPPVLHGLALLLTSHYDLDASRIVLVGNWMWAGMHKVNPSFLSNSVAIVDEVLAWVLVEEAVERNRMRWHLVVALGEAGAGMILLIAGCRGMEKAGKVLRACVRIAVVHLAVMHCVIVMQLLRLKWNYSVIGWNVSCLLLVVTLWRPWWQWRAEIRNDDTSTVSQSTSQVLAVFCFVLMPSLVTLGRLDPYLGCAVYTENHPSLQIELPALFDSDHIQLIYDSYGFVTGKEFDNPPRYLVLPARTHDNRYIYRTDSVILHVQAGGSVGYPAVWSFKALATGLCDQIDESEKAIFRILESYSGMSLWRGLMGLWHDHDAEIYKPSMFIMRGCKSSWISVDRREHSDPSEVRVEFSLSSDIYQYFGKVDIFWANGSLEPTDLDHGVNSARWKTRLDFQESLLLPNQTITRYTHIGHYFVAIAGQNEDECVIDVMIITDD